MDEQAMEAIELSKRFSRLYLESDDICSIGPTFVNPEFVPGIQVYSLDGLRKFQPDEVQWVDDGENDKFVHNYHAMVDGVFVHYHSKAEAGNV